MHKMQDRGEFTVFNVVFGKAIKLRSFCHAVIYTGNCVSWVVLRSGYLFSI